jgi:hypothetical protein
MNIKLRLPHLGYCYLEQDDSNPSSLWVVYHSSLLSRQVSLILPEPGHRAMDQWLYPRGVLDFDVCLLPFWLIVVGWV